MINWLEKIYECKYKVFSFIYDVEKRPKPWKMLLNSEKRANLPPKIDII